MDLRDIFRKKIADLKGRPSTFEHLESPPVHFPAVREEVNTQVVAIKEQLAATKSLSIQVHDVLDLNADGVNAVALRIRRDVDTLLTLGISDHQCNCAGTLAQHAIALSSKGRGKALSGEENETSIEQRIEAVSTAMVLAKKAETMIKEAKISNMQMIKNAIKTQEEALAHMKHIHQLT